MLVINVYCSLAVACLLSVVYKFTLVCTVVWEKFGMKKFLLEAECDEN